MTHQTSTKTTELNLPQGQECKHYKVHDTLDVIVRANSNTRVYVILHPNRTPDRSRWLALKADDRTIVTAEYCQQKKETTFFFNKAATVVTIVITDAMIHHLWNALENLVYSTRKANRASLRLVNVVIDVENGKWTVKTIHRKVAGPGTPISTLEENMEMYSLVGRKAARQLGKLVGKTVKRSFPQFNEFW